MKAKAKQAARLQKRVAAYEDRHDQLYARIKRSQRSHSKESPAMGARCKHKRHGLGVVIHVNDRQRTVRFDDVLAGVKRVPVYELQEIV